MTVLGADRFGLEQVARHAVTTYIRSHPATAKWREELLQDAYLGVTRALRDYDPDRGMSLASYAFMRATHTIQDGRRDAFVRRTGAARPETDWVPFSAFVNEDGESFLLDRPDPAAEQVFDELVDAQENARLVAWFLEQLTPRERLVLARYFLHEWTLAELGEAMGVTESRVAQIKTKALLQLRAIA